MNNTIMELEKLKAITGTGIFPISKEIVKAPDILEQFTEISNSIASLSRKEAEQIFRKYDSLIANTADWLKLKDKNAKCDEKLMLINNNGIDWIRDSDIYLNVAMTMHRIFDYIYSCKNKDINLSLKYVLSKDRPLRIIVDNLQFMRAINENTKM